MRSERIEAVAFDCYGTLVDFGDEAFARAYGQICAEQGIPIDGKTFFDKWMLIWRRLAQGGAATDGGSIGVVSAKVLMQSEAEHPERFQSIEATNTLNQPGPLSEAELILFHPEHHTPSAGRSRSLEGPLPPYRPYREEWPEHFAVCFDEFGVRGDPHAAYERLVELLSQAQAFPEALDVVETVGRRLPVAVLSNADDDFLRPSLARNGLAFPVVVSSESARAYKPHVSIFAALIQAMGVPRANILYVGDSRLADVVGAKNAGLKAAWLNRRGALNRSLETIGSSSSGAAEVLRRFPPDHEIDSLSRIIQIIGAGGP